VFEEFKEYLRFDGSEADLTPLINSAKLYIKNATGKEFDEKNELHRLAGKLLVNHWYENREPTGKADKLGFSLDGILLQIKYCGDEV
jgi:hypothetical protein